MAFQYTSRKKYKACFTCDSDRDSDRIDYWSKGMKNIWWNNYSFDLRRRDGSCKGNCNGHCDKFCKCKIIGYYSDYVLLEDCHGKVYAIYFKDICNTHVHCGCRHDDDWKKYNFLFD